MKNTKTQITTKRYSEYRDSGVDWIGDIPADWDAIRLGTRFTERRSKVSDKDYAPLSVTKNGILPQLATAAKTNDGDNRKMVKKGDFVINSRSDRKGSSGIAYQDGSVSLINLVIKPNALHSNYCNYLLKGYSFIEEFYRMGHGIVADLWTTRYDEMKNIKIAFPSLPEQKTIAEFLDAKCEKIDWAVEQKERMIKLLKERKQIVIQSAVTRGLDPDAKMKDSGVEWIGEIPVHWEVKRLKFVSTIQSGLTLGKNYNQKIFTEFPYLRVANVQSGYFKLSNIKTVRIPKPEAKRYLLRRNDILVTEGGDIDKLGRGTVWKSEIDPCLHQNHIFAIRLTGAHLQQAFVSLFMSIHKVRKYFINTAIKTTNLACTNRTTLKNLSLLCPPTSEQTAIAEHIEAESAKLDKAIAVQENLIEKLKEYKATLIDSAVTGKIKVF